MAQGGEFQPENLVGKAIRHLKDKDVDPATLFRGMCEAYLRLMALNESKGELQIPVTEDDYLGVKGLKFAKYSYDIPETNKSLDFTSLVGFRYSPSLRVYGFPTGSAFRCFVTDMGDYIHTAKIVDRAPKAIAAFTGPTFLIGEDLPNNGFYHSHFGLLKEFPKINSMSGAFSLTDGKVATYSAADKWKIVEDGYKGVEVLIGTSYYLSNYEQLSSAPELVGTRTHASYLFQFKSPDGVLETAYLVTKNIISRSIIYKVLADYSARFGQGSFLGVELELSGASITVNGPTSRETFGGGGFNRRRDHYLVFPPQE